MQKEQEPKEQEEHNHPIKLYLQPAIWQALKKQAQEEEEISLSVAIRSKIVKGFSLKTQVPKRFRPAANQAGRGIRGERVGPPLNVRLPYGWVLLFKEQAQQEGLSLRAYIRNCIIKALIYEKKIK
jgi:hypothetical protein